MKVELGSKSRVIIPSQVRKKARARRFELREEMVRRKYKGLFKGKKIEQVEEDQERFIKLH